MYTLSLYLDNFTFVGLVALAIFNYLTSDNKIINIDSVRTLAEKIFIVSLIGKHTKFLAIVSNILIICLKKQYRLTEDVYKDYLTRLVIRKNNTLIIKNN